MHGVLICIAFCPSVSPMSLDQKSRLENKSYLKKQSLYPRWKLKVCKSILIIYLTVSLLDIGRWAHFNLKLHFPSSAAEKIVFGNLKPCTYLQEEGLHIYVDGLKAASDPSGTDRIYTFPKFDPWKKILLGKANDDRHLDPVPTLDIFNVTHFAKYYTFDQISTFYSKFKHFLLITMNHFPNRFYFR